ncbi:hypothetical protein LCGC14_0921010 [marine sediment metagenome]|uniref:Uncharacterized protein n=1 Tax=marine sediment metagenome TaxID=412755 RepID=A0A0F9PBI6_9ZZZZ
MSEQPQVQPAEGFKPLAEWGEIEALSSEELEAWKRSPVTRLESRVIATIARLQEQVKEAEERLSERIDSWDTAFRGIEAVAKTLLTERNEAKALAERLTEALDAWVRYSISSKPSKELLVEALRLTDAASEEEKP